MVEKIGKTWAAHASWVDSSGRRHRKYKSGFALKREAEAWEEEYIRTHCELANDAEEITVGEFLDKYLAAQKHSISPNTYSGYKVCINRLKRFCGNRKLYSMKRLDYELVFQAMSADSTITRSGNPGKKTISRNTLHYCYRVLRSALNFAVESDYLEKNPALKLRLPVSEQRHEYKIIDAKDGGRLLVTLREWDYQLYLVCLLCLVYGMRRGEALGLQWSDINFDTDEIRIHGQYTSGEHGNEYREALKTSSSYRKLSLDPFVKAELAKARAALTKTGRITQYVCEFDGLPSPNAITKRWRAFADKHGFEGVRLHDLRHSSAMIMIQSGVDLNTIKKQLGHAKISTTEIYLHDDFAQSGKAANHVVMSLFQPTKETNTKISG